MPLEERSSSEGVFLARLPSSATLGVAWRASPWLLVAADLSGHAPLARYRALQTEDLSETVEKKAVVNGALGAELWIAPVVPFRMGFYSDRSARRAGPTDSLGDLAADELVLTGSIGYEHERAGIVLGGAFSRGRLEDDAVIMTREEIRWWVAGSYRL
jgi:hypothetical protein